MELHVNGRRHVAELDPEMPLLWALRDVLGMTGTKFGCGMGLCGACTVHVDGRPVRACITPVGTVGQARVTTIEGLHPEGRHPLQEAWRACRVPQCGYCQPGQLMQAAGLLKDHPRPTDAQIDEAMSGNLCRCGTYPRIREAIRRACGRVAKAEEA